MDEQVADKTAAIILGQVDEPSKNALKKANKQMKLAEDKANKSATNTTKEAARSEAKRAVTKAPKKKIEGAALIGYAVFSARQEGNANQAITSIDIAKGEDFSGW